MRQVAVLFAEPNSVYHSIEGVDVWDQKRDARCWPPGDPVVAHPPCAQWGRLRKFANTNEAEKDLACLAVKWLRAHGGVLEHPQHSTLWKQMGMSETETPDFWGGWTLKANQSLWGHPARKMTWFYIVGVAPRDLPVIPLFEPEPTHLVETRSRSRRHLVLPKSRRSSTPPRLAQWLVELARQTNV